MKRLFAVVLALLIGVLLALLVAPYVRAEGHLLDPSSPPPAATITLGVDG